MSRKPNIEFDLLSNARDSLRRAVRELAWGDGGSDPSRLKHAILNSAHCIELLLKERLRQVNPAFIWENVDKYPSLDARTVTVSTAIARLKNIGGVTFTANDERNLRSLSRARNAIQHYRWEATEKEVKVILGNALSFAFSFASEGLKTDLAEEFKEDDTWRSLVEELHEFVRAHGERLEAKLRDKGGYHPTCGNCGYPAVPPWAGSCELCGHWQGIDDDP
jgi:hypothetical protein